MAPDEIEAAINRAEEKLRELEQQQPAAKASAKLFSMVPKAAQAYRKQVAAGLDGNPREAEKARALLRRLCVDGKVTLIPGEDGSLTAVGAFAPAVLLQAASGGVVTGGRGRGI